MYNYTAHTFSPTQDIWTGGSIKSTSYDCELKVIAASPEKCGVVTLMGKHIDRP